MKVTEVHDHICTMYRSGERQTSLLIGPPGIGKSAIIAQAADTLGIAFRATPPLPTLEPVDIAGMYDVVRVGDDPARSYAQRVPFTDIVPTEGTGILVIDDVTTAVPSTQASLYGLVHERRVGSAHVGEGWLIVCTSNRASDNAATHRMPSPLVSRMEWLQVEEDFLGWEKYMAGKGASALVRGYLHNSPQSFLDFDPERPDQPFACPRSWEYVARTFDAYERVGGLGHLPPEPAVAGRVGEAHSLQLMAFCRANALLVSPDEVFHDPLRAPIPETPGGLFVLLTALANAVRYDTMDALVTYLDRKGITEELGLYTARAAIAVDEGRMSRMPADEKDKYAKRQIVHAPAFRRLSEGRRELFYSVLVGR